MSDKQVNFQPSLDRVLVKMEDAEETTASGLVVTTSGNKNKATVLAVGPGSRYWDQKNANTVTIPTRYEVGQKVLVPRKEMLTEVSLDGESYYLVKESEVLGVLTK